VLSQNAEWKTLIQERFPGDVVPDFDKKEWLQDGNKSHYDFFMVAAKEHLEMVRSFVSEKGINLDSENLM
jgi:hypothetical protein